MTSRSQVNYDTRRGGGGTRGNLSDNSGEKSSDYGSRDSSIEDENYEKSADYGSPGEMIFAQHGDSNGDEDSLIHSEIVQEIHRKMRTIPERNYIP